MFKLSVKAEFSAAHSLRGYKGKCEDLHGHNWKVEVVITSGRLDKNGLAIDFHEIKNLLNQALKEMDHKHLNNLRYFKKANPTSENISRYIYEKLQRLLPGGSCKLKEVTVWESDNCSATYSK